MLGAGVSFKTDHQSLIPTTSGDLDLPDKPGYGCKLSLDNKLSTDAKNHTETNTLGYCEQNLR